MENFVIVKEESFKIIGLALGGLFDGGMVFVNILDKAKINLIVRVFHKLFNVHHFYVFKGFNGFNVA